MSLLRARSVQGLAIAVLLSVVLVVMLGYAGVPFDRPAVGSTDPAANLIGQLIQFIFAIFVIFIAFRITRKRREVDFDGRTPEKRVAMREMVWLLVYGVVVLFAGGLNGIGMHLHGQSTDPLERSDRETFTYGPRTISSSLLLSHMPSSGGEDMITERCA